VLLGVVSHICFLSPRGPHGQEKRCRLPVAGLPKVAGDPDRPTRDVDYGDVNEEVGHVSHSCLCEESALRRLKIVGEVGRRDEPLIIMVLRIAGNHIACLW